MVHYCVHNKPAMDPSNAVHILTPCFFKICFNITVPFVSVFQNGRFSSSNETENVQDMHCLPYESVSKSSRTGRLERECKWYISLSLSAVVSLFCESV
jgi:hypothetical protein